MRYFIGKDGQRLGPFDAQHVREQLDAGAYSYDDLVWRDGMAAWAPLRTEFPPLSTPPSTPPGVASVPPIPGATPAFGAAPSAFGAPTTISDPQLASRGRRLGAVSIDHLIAFLALLPALLRFFPGFMELVQRSIETNQEPDQAELVRLFIDSAGSSLFLLLIVGLVQMILLCVRGQTVGKLLCRIRIVRTNGAPAGFVHAFVLRTVVMSFITSIPFLGMVVALIDPLFIFREDHRCLHDLLADTTVIET